MKRRPFLVAVLSLVAATLFWAGNFVLGAGAVDEVDPLSLLLLRWGLAAVPLLVLAQLIERPDWRAVLRAWRWLLVLSITGLFGYALLLYSALQFTDAFTASLVNAFNPALITIAAVIVLRERLTAPAVIGIVLALAGVLIVLSGGSLDALLHAGGGSGLGDLLMLGAITAWTAYTILGRLSPRVPPITAVACQAVIATVLTVPLTLLTGGPHLPVSAGGWGSVAFIVLFPSLLSYLLWNRALAVIPPARAGVFLNLITVFTALFTLLAGHPFTVAQLLGGAIVLGGVALANAGAFRRTPSPGQTALPPQRTGS